MMMVPLIYIHVYTFSNPSIHLSWSLGYPTIYSFGPVYPLVSNYSSIHPSPFIHQSPSIHQSASVHPSKYIHPFIQVDTCGLVVKFTLPIVEFDIAVGSRTSVRNAWEEVVAQTQDPTRYNQPNTIFILGKFVSKSAF